MDPIYEAAVAREDELLQELKKIRDFLATYRTLANSLKLDSANIIGTKVVPPTADTKGVDSAEAGAAREAEAPDAAPPKRIRVSDNPKPTIVVEAAVELIRAKGRPMTRREIRDELAARGIVVKGADPVKAVGTMLWRSGADQLVQIEGRGYWPKGDPVPPPSFRDIFGNRVLAGKAAP